MKILLLAYYFPPESSSGSFRPLFFSNHLCEFGENVTVITAQEKDFLPLQPRDPKLLDIVDSRVEIVRVRAFRSREMLLRIRKMFQLKRVSTSNNISITDQRPVSNITKNKGLWQKIKDFVTDLLTTPDDHIGWMPHAVNVGLKIIKNNGVDVILATASPWSTLLVACVLKKITGVPIVLDFRDPWVSNPGFRLRGSFVARIDRWLEKWVVSSADAIIANTEEAREDFLTRFPLLSKSSVITITNGFEDYMPIREHKNHSNRPLIITHTGEIYWSRNPRPFLEAVDQLVKEGKITSSELRIRFIGGLEPKDIISKLIINLCECGVLEIMQRVPYNNALEYMEESDILLLLQAGFLLQVPRKLYEYMAFRKPIFCISEIDSPSARIVREYNLGTVAVNTVEAIGNYLLGLLTDWEKGELNTYLGNRCDNFKNRVLSKKLLSVLNNVSNADR